MHLTEDLLNQNPNIAAYAAPSLNARQEGHGHMVVVEVPRLGAEAAEKAIKEWGQPKSSITHLIFCTTSGGCYGGGTALRIAKDLAENNAGARVLAVCSEITAISFRGPTEAHLDNLVGQALFGDAADSDTVAGAEKPLFEIFSAAQAIFPEGGIEGSLRESGLMIHLLRDVPGLISAHMEESLKRAFGPLGISDWNSVFWIAHPGGPAILDQIEAELGLKPEKLRLSRHVGYDKGSYQKSSAKEGLTTTGEGHDWGVLFGFGPGLTVETVVLRSMPIHSL
ncbi:hypothetical protein SASPL_112465 [Salvia splendens]|uniref:chalcone synthase n=1 Tax=Salvia splendens TaxID=180675 RepID=A0A8X8YB96_SALSN|nr:hypothetical protein SASPL_112465 [Salvia splendens]